jgi:hypothetical protein
MINQESCMSPTFNTSDSSSWLGRHPCSARALAAAGGSSVALHRESTRCAIRARFTTRTADRARSAVGHAIGDLGKCEPTYSAWPVLRHAFRAGVALLIDDIDLTEGISKHSTTSSWFSSQMKMSGFFSSLSRSLSEEVKAYTNSHPIRGRMLGASANSANSDPMSDGEQAIQ